MLSAGYETTGQTMGYILYELAMNQECQESLYEEIMDAVDDVDDLTYEMIQSLPYIDAVIHETMRKHPIFAWLERVCTKEYKLPGHELIIPKGGLVRANSVGICYDPEIFPNPNDFIPERFLKENRGERNPYSFMGFSLGPRNCLAMRFAMFEMKMCISSLVSKFRFLPSERTVKEVEWDPASFFGGAKGGLWITGENR
jgi:cytochrome P450